MQFHYVTTNLQSGSLCDFAMFCSPLVTLGDSLQRAWACPGTEDRTDAAKFSSVWTVANSSELSGHTVVVYCQAKSYNRTTHPLSNFQLKCRGLFKRALILCPQPQQVLCHLLTITEHLNLRSTSEGRWLVAEMVPWLCGPMRAEMPMVMVSNRRTRTSEGDPTTALVQTTLHGFSKPKFEAVPKMADSNHIY